MRIRDAGPTSCPFIFSLNLVFAKTQGQFNVYMVYKLNEYTGKYTQ